MHDSSPNSESLFLKMHCIQRFMSIHFSCCFNPTHCTQDTVITFKKGLKMLIIHINKTIKPLHQEPRFKQQVVRLSTKII